MLPIIMPLSAVCLLHGRAGATLEKLDVGVGMVQALLVVGQVALIGVMLVPAQRLALHRMPSWHKACIRSIYGLVLARSGPAHCLVK